MSSTTGNDLTYTALNLFETPGSMIERSELTANSSDILPDAVDIVSVFVGTSGLDATGNKIDFWIFNDSDYIITINVGTGTIMKPGPTDTIQSYSIKKYSLLVTSNTTVTIFNTDQNGQKIVTTEIETAVISRDPQSNTVTTIWGGEGDIVIGSGTNSNIVSNGNLSIYGNVFQYQTVSELTAGSDLQYTVGQIMGGLIKRSSGNSNVIDTFPNAADIVSAIPNATIGSSFFCQIQNMNSSNKSITFADGTGTVISGDDKELERRKTVQLLFICNNVTLSTESVAVYILGTMSSLGGDAYNITKITTSSYTILESDNSINVDTETIGQDCSLTLPLISTIGPKRYTITDYTGKAGYYNIIVNCSGSDTIVNSSSFTLNSNYSSISIFNDEIDKWIIY